MLGFFYVQSEYSMLDSALFLEDLVCKSKEYGYSFVALSDTNMHGAYKFYKACLREGIKPIIGLKISIESRIKASTFLLIYAYNNEGYENLLSIATELSLNNIVSLTTLKSFSKGLFAVTPGMDGDIEQYLLSGQMEEANKQLSFYNSIFSKVFLGLEIQSLEGDVNAQNVIELSVKTQNDILPISKTFYLNKEDRKAFECLQKIKNSDKNIEIGYADYYLRSKSELEIDFSSYAKYLGKLQEVYDMVDVSLLKTKQSLPHYPVPNNQESREYLKELCYLGLKKRLDNRYGRIKEYFDRLEYELGVINSMGYSDYFLIVWDFVKYAKKKGILVGPGRGSAAGSLVAYSLGITEVDPLIYDLLFERFLNPERITMPDIDMDFPDDRREEVIQYVADKYGVKHVSNISTFNRFQARLALRDVSRTLYDEKIIETIIKEIDPSLSIMENMQNPKVKNILMENEDLNNIFHIALKIEGLPKNISTHAAGIILSEEELTKSTPLLMGTNGLYQTQFEALDLEELGLLKIDFLGLKNLTIINQIQTMIGKLSMKDIVLSDEKTFGLLSDGKTNGVFQLESEGMKKVLRKLKPNNIEDVIAVLALFRPGPMGQIDDYIARKNGQEFSYLHKDLELILKKTYGVIVYQEQIMRIAHEFAGYSLGEADILRRAVSKKKAEVLIKERERFVNHCLKKGYKEDEGNLIYDYIVKFANYGFNRNHSVPYAMIAYQMAYLKVHYPLYFFTTLLSNVASSASQIQSYIQEAREFDIEVVKPNIHKSTTAFVCDKEIYLPLTAIKYVGGSVAKIIIDERNKEPFKDYADFKKRTKITGNVLESLIYSGALDFSLSKKEMIKRMDPDYEAFNLGISFGSTEESEEFSLIELLKYEKEALGFNLSYSILDPYRDLMDKQKILSIASAQLLAVNSTAKVLGFVKKKRDIKTKAGELMSFLQVSDGINENECVIFPKIFKKISAIISRYDIILLFEIVIQTRDNRLQWEIIDVSEVK